MKISRSRVYSWHSWLGLVTGLFMILIGFSGAVAVFKHELDWLVTPALRVEPSPSEAPVDALIASLEAKYPGGKVENLGFRDGPRSAHVAYVKTAAGDRFQVHLDPVTAAVRGERISDGSYTSSLANFIRQFHVRLLMGFWGRVFVGAFGVTLFLSCLTGIYVYRNWIKTLFRVRFRAGWRLLVSDMHKSVGLASLLFNLLIGATGAVLGLENLYGKARHDWMGVEREKPPRLSKEQLAAYGDSARTLPASALLAAAAAHFPDMKPTSLQFPGKPGALAAVRGDHPGIFIANGASQVYLDPFGGKVVKAEDARAGSFGARLYDTFDPLHFGYFGARIGGALSAWFEYAVKTLWLLLGMTPGLLAISGFWLWASRARRKPIRPGTSASRPGSPVSRTSSEAVPATAATAAQAPLS